MANIDVTEGRADTRPAEPTAPEPGGLGTGFRAVIYELRRVVWPTRQELLRMTLVVVITVIAIATFIGVVDALLAQVFNAVYKTQ